jgi:hypothetical protein
MLSSCEAIRRRWGSNHFTFGACRILHKLHQPKSLLLGISTIRIGISDIFTEVTMNILGP